MVHNYFVGNTGVLVHNARDCLLDIEFEPQRFGPAADFENSLAGAASDIASGKRIVPVLKYSNPNPHPNAKDYIKFDGRDPFDPNTFIDRKYNVTTKSKQVGDIQRVAEALRQNPQAKLVIEVPDASAERVALRALQKAGEGANPQIIVRIAP
jgi:hypothetical protein